jgi:AraC-like DNA-binding protein
MIRCTSLLEGTGIAVGHFDHPSGDAHHDPAEELASTHSINLVQRGRFSIQVGRRIWEVGPGDIFITYPGLEYRCRHKEEVPSDVCISLEFRPTGEDHPELATFTAIAKSMTVRPATNRMVYLFRKFVPVPSPSILPGLVTNPVAAEEVAGDLLSEISGEREQPRRSYSQRQLAWYAERVDAARQLLEKNFSVEHSLASVARSVGMSMFHFARIFGELAGTPPHQYLLQVRLNEARRQLRGGASVTESCFSSGFHNLSHFVRLFHHRFGVSPAQYGRQQASQPATAIPSCELRSPTPSTVLR